MKREAALFPVNPGPRSIGTVIVKMYRDTFSLICIATIYVKCAPYLFESKDLSSFLLNIKIDSGP